MCMFFFFFKQKTAYEMRISDWSSDVCSSDLIEELRKRVDTPCPCSHRRRNGGRPMSGKHSNNRAVLRSEAAYWYNERLAGDMTPEDEYRFRDWVNRSPSHREAYKAVDRAWFVAGTAKDDPALRSEEHTSALQSLMRSSYAVFCLQQ